MVRTTPPSASWILARRAATWCVTYLLIGAGIQFAVAWLSALAAMIAEPPSGNRKATWVASGTATGFGENSLEGAAGAYQWNGWRAGGVLARTCSLRWWQTSTTVETGPGAVPVRPPLESTLAAIDARFRPETDAWLATLHPPVGAPMAILEFNSYGFPVKSMAFSMRTDYERIGVGQSVSYLPRFSIRAGLDASGVTPYTAPRPALVLPLRPLWPEVLVDALIWGAFAFACFPGAAMLRARLRRRRGRCPACAYDRRGLAPGAPCPECGR